MKISVSLLSGYLYCSRKVFLERVLMIQEPPKESLVMGTIRHEAYDKINKNEEIIVTSIIKNMSFDDIQTLYRQQYLKILRKAITNSKKRLDGVNLNMMDAYKKSFPFIMEESVARANNVFSFMETNNLFGKELFRVFPKTKVVKVWDFSGRRVNGYRGLCPVEPEGVASDLFQDQSENAKENKSGELFH